MVSFSDGMPLPTGTIIFEDDTHTFSANINEDGEFRMGMLREGEGLPAGKYKVAIVGAFTTEQVVFSPEYPNGGPPILKHLVAEKFRSTQTSSIEYEVKSSNRNISFIIEKP
jgi:hypothetical protein